MSANLAILASGGGSNAQALIDCLRTSSVAQVAVVVSNKADAFVLERARQANIPAEVLTQPQDAAAMLELLARYDIDFIALAGYLKKIPNEVVAAFAGRIVNIHPSLLPKFGGKGMYGLRVHEAVLAAGEPETGVTIHYVTEEYDEGAVIRQEKLAIQPDWDAATLQQHVLAIEHRLYAPTIEMLLR